MVSKSVDFCFKLLILIRALGTVTETKNCGTHSLISVAVKGMDRNIWKWKVTCQLRGLIESVKIQKVIG